MDVASQPHDWEIYHFFEKTFRKANPDYFKQLSKKAFGKEGTALQKLEAIALDKPDPMAWANDFLDTAQHMRNSKDKLYRSWPFLASTLACPECGGRVLGDICMKCG